MNFRKRAYSLIELLMAIAILSLLAALILAVLAPLREKGRQTVCMSNLSQLGKALNMYRDDYDGIDPEQGSHTPPGSLGFPPPYSLSYMWRTYAKNKSLLFCPNFQRDANNYGDASSYAWPIAAWGVFDGPHGIQNQVRVRGDQAVIAYCEWHHPKLTGNEPKWERKRVIVLRLSGRVSNHEVPVRTSFETY